MNQALLEAQRQSNAPNLIRNDHHRQLYGIENYSRYLSGVNKASHRQPYLNIA